MVHWWTDGVRRGEILSTRYGETGEEWRPGKFRQDEPVIGVLGIVERGVGKRWMDKAGARRLWAQKDGPKDIEKSTMRKTISIQIFKPNDERLFDEYLKTTKLQHWLQLPVTDYTLLTIYYLTSFIKDKQYNNILSRHYNTINPCS
jgi:hypothetical protein